MRVKKTSPEAIYLSVDEAAKVLGVGRSTLYRAAKKRTIPHHVDPIRGWLRFTKGDLDEIEAMSARPLVAVRPAA